MPSPPGIWNSGSAIVYFQWEILLCRVWSRSAVFKLRRIASPQWIRLRHVRHPHCSQPSGKQPQGLVEWLKCGRRNTFREFTNHGGVVEVANRPTTFTGYAPRRDPTECSAYYCSAGQNYEFKSITCCFFYHFLSLNKIKLICTSTQTVC